MATVIDPCLGPEGYIRNEMQIGLKIFSRYYLSHHSQDILYRGGTASLNKDIQVSTGNMAKLRDTVETTLSKLFGLAFDNVDINVEVKPLRGDVSKQTLIISIRFGTTTHNDLRYGLKTPFEEQTIIQYSKVGDIVLKGPRP